MDRLVEAYVMWIDGQAAVVRFRDNRGMLQGRIIPKDSVPGINMGRVVHIPIDILEADSTTEYGFDWSVVLDELVLKPEDFQQALRGHGIWTVDDLLQNPQEGIAAFLALAKSMYTSLIRKARGSFIN